MLSHALYVAVEILCCSHLLGELCQLLHSDEKDGVEDNEYRVDARQACLLAAKCCMNLHQSLHKYPTGFAGKTLTLHIGAGFGRVTILQVSFSRDPLCRRP